MELVIDATDLAEARKRLQHAVDRHGSQLAFAQAHGLSHTIISQALRGRIDPPPALLAALGLQRIVRYRDVDTNDAAADLPYVQGVKG